MIKKLHFYIIKEFFGSFLFGVVVFSILLIINMIFTMMDLLVSKGVAFFLVLKMFIFYLPNILTLSIPMAVLFGVLLSYGKLSSDNEITAMKSSGLSYKTLTMPIVILVCIISFFLVFFNHFFAPAINSHQRTLIEELATKSPLVKFHEKSVTNFGKYSLFANKVNNNDNSLYGISIYKFKNKDDAMVDTNSGKKNVLPQNDKGAWRISASSATVKAYRNGAQLTLHHGYWQKAHPENLNSMIHMTFKTYVFFIPLGNTIRGHSVEPSEIQSPQLLKTIKEYKNQGIPFMPYERDYWFRWIFAFAPIAFVFIALPIGMMTGKGSKAIGFGISLVVILVYYMLLMLSIILGENIPLGIIMWLPDFVIMAIGSYLFIKMVKK
jgi:lipopolysaccharide export LptBFGC system permease protein LptF